MDTTVSVSINGHLWCTLVGLFWTFYRPRPRLYEWSVLYENLGLMLEIYEHFVCFVIVKKPAVSVNLNKLLQ